MHKIHKNNSNNGQVSVQVVFHVTDKKEQLDTVLLKIVE